MRFPYSADTSETAFDQEENCSQSVQNLPDKENRVQLIVRQVL